MANPKDRAAAVARKLVLFNGRWDEHGNHRMHIYVAAYSKADAVRMLEEIKPGAKFANEVNLYFSKDCWGLEMEGITPERGAWVTDETKRGAPPRRVYP